MNTTVRVLDLFSGIGGFSLGLERAGMRTVAFCEIDPFCRAVLAKHWPDVPVFGDIGELTAASLVANTDYQRQLQSGGGECEKRRWAGDCGIDLICGGFPCQDISLAGKGAGLAGERSGLWSEYARIIGEVRPRYVFVENVAALLGRGLDRVLGDLATLGFDAEWHCIPASAVGAPHRRDRIWIVAYPQRSELRDEPRRWDGARWPSEAEPGDNGAPEPVADPNGPRLAIWPGTLREWAHAEFTGTGWWAVEPDVGRVASRVPSRVERLRSLGNALVPQIPEIIGRAILAAEEYKPIWPIGTHVWRARSLGKAISPYV